jgi:hypothetical protein
MVLSALMESIHTLVFVRLVPRFRRLHKLSASQV